MKSLKKLLGNKRGVASYNYILMVVALMLINMLYGTMENNLAVMTVNEVRDVLETCAPNAIRAGISEDAIRNETIVEEFDAEEAINTFAEDVSSALSNTTFGNRIITPGNESNTNAPDRAFLFDRVLNNTIVTVDRGSWANTIGDEDVDVAVLTTVFPLEIKHSRTVSDARRIEASFDRIDASGNLISAGADNAFNVDVTVNRDSLVALVRFEMRMILK